MGGWGGRQAPILSPECWISVIKGSQAVAVHQSPELSFLKFKRHPLLVMSSCYQPIHHRHYASSCRGGGELGSAWHKAGQRSKKPTTFADVLVAAEKLQAQVHWEPYL